MSEQIQGITDQELTINTPYQVYLSAVNQWFDVRLIEIHFEAPYTEFIGVTPLWDEWPQVYAVRIFKDSGYEVDEPPRDSGRLMQANLTREQWSKHLRRKEMPDE